MAGPNPPDGRPQSNPSRALLHAGDLCNDASSTWGLVWAIGQIAPGQCRDHIDHSPQISLARSQRFIGKLLVVNVGGGTDAFGGGLFLPHHARQRLAGDASDKSHA